MREEVRGRASTPPSMVSPGTQSYCPLVEAMQVAVLTAALSPITLADVLFSLLVEES